MKKNFLEYQRKERPGCIGGLDTKPMVKKKRKKQNKLDNHLIKFQKFGHEKKILF